MGGAVACKGRCHGNLDRNRHGTPCGNLTACHGNPHGTPMSTASGLRLGLGFHGMPCRSVEGSVEDAVKCFAAGVKRYATASREKGQ